MEKIKNISAILICMICVIGITMSVLASSYSIRTSGRKSGSSMGGLVSMEVTSTIGFEDNNSSYIKLYSLGVLAKNTSSYSQITNAYYIASDGLASHTSSKYDVLINPLNYGQSVYHERIWSTVESNRTYYKNGGSQLAYFECSALTNLDAGEGHTIVCYSDNGIGFY